MLVATVMMILSFATSALASDSHTKPCSQQETRQAEDDVNHLQNWDQVYRSYRRFSHCDHGAIGESYSTAIGKLLADRWIRFARLATLVKTDKGFQQFVLRHIAKTLPSDILDKIKENSQLHCPGRQTRLCRLITKAASIE